MRVLGKRIYSYNQVESTNRIAYQLAEQGAKEGTVVIAKKQTKGEGRASRYWFSPLRGLWLSLILRPLMANRCVSRLSMLGAVGVAVSIKRMYSFLSPRVRWPNDVTIDGKKVAGVLCLAKSEQGKVLFVIMGIGINLNIEEFPSPLCFTATSLKREVGSSVSEKTFQQYLLEELGRFYFSSQDNFSVLLEEIRPFSSFLGKQLKVETRKEELTGVAQDIDEEGRLILRLESGVQRRISPEEGHIKYEFGHRCR